MIEKTDVKVTLATLNVQLAVQSADLKEIKQLFKDHIDEEEASIDAINISINGHDKEPGIRGRLQSLENAVSQGKWVTGIFVGALITSGVGYYFFR